MIDTRPMETYLATLKDKEVTIDISYEGVHKLTVQRKSETITAAKAAHEVTPYARIHTQDKDLEQEIKRCLAEEENMVISLVGEAAFQPYGDIHPSSSGDCSMARVERLSKIAEEKCQWLLETHGEKTLSFSVRIEGRTNESKVLTPEGITSSYEESFFYGAIQRGEKSYDFTLPMPLLSEEAKRFLNGNSLSEGKRAFFPEDAFFAFFLIGKREEILLDLAMEALPEISSPGEAHTSSREGECMGVSDSSGEESVLLSGYVMDQILITAWKMFTGKNNEDGSTPFAGKQGERIASSNINFFDVPSLSFPCSETGFIRKVDAQGRNVKPTVVVKEGVLVDLLTTCESSHFLSKPSNGHAGRTATLVRGTAPIETPANFILVPGEATLDELLNSKEDLIYIYDAFDQFHALNTGSGEFEFPIRYARIHQGRPVGKVTRATMKGRFQDLLLGIEKSGKTITIQPLVIMETYTVGSPAVLTKGLTIT